MEGGNKISNSHGAYTWPVVVAWGVWADSMNSCGPTRVLHPATRLGDLNPYSRATRLRGKC